jgi:hypothetical protein
MIHCKRLSIEVCCQQSLRMTQRFDPKARAARGTFERQEFLRILRYREVVLRQSFRRGVLRLYRREDVLPCLPGRGVPSLDLLDLLSQGIILDNLTNPSRIIVAERMMKPGIIVHAACDRMKVLKF